MSAVCQWKGGCVALATIDGFCAPHSQTCIQCGCPQSWHPVVQMADMGPELVCGTFSSPVDAQRETDVREARRLMGLEGRS